MKKLLFLILLIFSAASSQYKDVTIKYNAADSTVLILPAFVEFNIPTLDTRLDSLIAVVVADKDSTTSHNTRINALMDSILNKYTKSDTRIVIADSLSEIRDSIGVRYTKTDTRSVVHDSVSFARDSIAIHRTELNAQMDSLKNKYTEEDTRTVIADSLAEVRDSIGVRYSSAIIDLLLAAKFDKSDTTDYLKQAMIEALLTYKFDKADTTDYLKQEMVEALLAYKFDKSDTTDYYKDVMIDAMLAYYYTRSDSNSATLGFYPRNMIDAKIAEITGTGVITLNGLSGVSQTLAIDTTITGAPAWSSATTVHTLQLPFLRFLKQSDTTTTLAMQWELDGKQNAISNLADTSKYLEPMDTANATYGWYKRSYVDALLNAKQNTISNLADTSKYVEVADSAAANGWVNKTRADNQYEVKGTTLLISTILMQNGSGTDSSCMATTLNIPMGISTGIKVDTIVYVMVGGSSPSVVPSIKFGTDISAAGTALINSPSEVTSNSTATRVSTFDTSSIPSGAMVWLSFTTITTKPKIFCVYILGHRE